MNSLSTTDESTCDWCHPNPGNPRSGTGEAAHNDDVSPADLHMNGRPGAAITHFKDIGGGADTGESVSQPADQQVSCSSVNCHYNNTVAAADWYGTPAVTCAYCHTDDSAYTAGALPNAHDRHVDEVADGGYNFACTTCHVDNAGNNAHQDDVIDLSTANLPYDTDGDAALNPGTVTDPKYGTGTAASEYTSCSAVYCHGDFEGNGSATVGGGNPANVPNWFNTDAQVGAGLGDGRCGTCHGDTAGADAIAKAYPRTGSYTESHAEHVTSNPDPGCSSCHNSDANGAAVGQGTYGDEAMHASGAVNLIFGAAGGETETVNYEASTATYDDVVGNGAATGTESCSNVRCHNGVTTPAFDATDGGTGDNITCGDCHAIPPASASVAGSHSAHASVQADCANCHTNSVSYTAVGGHADHQNLTVEIVPLGPGTYTDTVDTAGGVNWNVAGATHTDDGTCSSTSCHGAGTPAWGGTLTNGCFECHTGTEPTVKPVETPGNGPNVVDKAQYETDGHGNSTTFSWDSIAGPDFAFSYSGSPNAGCYECHDSGAQHAPTKSGTDPYRLGAWATDVNGLCLDCHGTSPPNPNAATNPLNLDILQHAKAITNPSSSHDWPPSGATDYEYKCVDCHDPHADGNIYMVRDRVNNPTAAGDTTMGSNSYGTPNDGTLSAITFTSTAGYAANSYAQSGANNDGICEVCHNQTAVYTNSGTENVGTHATRTGRCTTCHEHNTGFKGSGNCQDCHSSTQGPRRAVVDEFNTLASHHNSAVDGSTVTVDKFTCVQCHGEGNADGTVNATLHNNGASSPYPIDLKVYGTYPTVGSTVSINDIQSATQADLLNLNQHCLSCHNDTNNAAQPFSGNGDTNTPSVWAWDAYSVGSKFSNTGTTPFGKFDSSTYNVLPYDRIDKAYSPHGNVEANRGGYAVGGAWTDRGGAGSLSGAGNLGPRDSLGYLACLNCHNSHGSNVTYKWWIGDTTTTHTGGIIIDRASIGEPVGGYAPSTPTGENYPDEADLCWDCHLGDDVNAPIDYVGFGFSVGNQIGYYHENSTGDVPARWSSTLSWQSTFGFKDATIMSDHFGAFAGSATVPGGWSRNDMSCGACHDPHGVSSNQANAQFMVPALKGTWVTSPYKEDRPPRVDNPGSSSTMFNQGPADDFWEDVYAGYPTPRANPEFKTNNWARNLNYNVPTASGGGMGLTKYEWTGASSGSYNSSSTRLGWDGFFIDENTFGTNGNVWGDTGAVTVNRMSDANAAITGPAIFAGLCITCHPQSNIGNLTSTTQGGDPAKVHNTVMGWAGANTNIFHRGWTVDSPWYATPPTMHGMNHTSYDGGWMTNYGPSGPTGWVWWGSGLKLGVIDPTAWPSSVAAHAHKYQWGPDPANQGPNQADDLSETAYHQFPCSKCHTPHVGRLPRLMRTNCLDNDGTNTINWGGAQVYKNQAGVVLYGNIYRNNACHSTYIGEATEATGTDANGMPTPAPQPGGWNAVTPW
ncbi:MAG: hypothetical protein GTO22_03370 [Gemmatimonadales bacterium]|nr:hypothetical protein [Gemmatimonadales bacterium]